MKLIKYILIHIETLILIFSFILGIGAAEVCKWGWAILLIFGPFAWGYLTNFSKRIAFCEAYRKSK